MPPSDPMHPQDYTHLSDEDLAIRARDHGDLDARNSLLVRCFHVSAGMICPVVCRGRLAGRAWEDAQQVASLAVLDAIQAYKDVPPGPRRVGRFRRFLCTVARRRVLNQARNQHRIEKHFCRKGFAVLPDGEPVGMAAGPVELAEWREMIAGVRRAVDRLPATDRHLVETLVSEESLQAAAATESLPYKVARRRLQRLVLVLRHALRRFVA